MSRALPLATLALALGCAPHLDSDHDGLSDRDERAFGSLPFDPDGDHDLSWDGQEFDAGTDPSDPDTDDDALDDGEERLLETDPLAPDSDRDGYRDGDEVAEGTDPLSDRSRIYVGNWPYVPDKDELDGSHRHQVARGREIPRWALVDQFGDEVEVWDFHGENVVIDLCPAWCGPCRGLQDWITGGFDAYGFSTAWPGGPEAVARGDVRWITVLVDGFDMGEATEADSSEWARLFPDARIPVLADADYRVIDAVSPPYTPTLLELTPDLRLLGVEGEDYFEVLQRLEARFPAR